MQVVIASNWVALLLTLLIPVAVATVTKANLDSKWKSLITLILSAVVVLVRRSQIEGGAAIISSQVAFDWAITTAVAIASYVGFWKPVTDVNNNVAPNTGVGPGPTGSE